MFIDNNKGDETPLSSGSGPAPQRDMRAHVRLITDPAYQGAYHAPLLTLSDDPIVIHDIAQVEAELAHRIDGAGHTACDLDKNELRHLLTLAQTDRASLLSERRGYVIARRGDQSRFVEMIRMLDAKIEQATKLTDKLAKLVRQ